MKIGILTLPLHTNYGGILQAYALQTVLVRMGHEVRVIAELPHRHPVYLLPLVWLRRVFVKWIFKRSVRVFYEYEEMVRRRNVDSFVDRYIKKKMVNSLSDIKEFDFDAILVGSDQIWRPKYYPEITHAFLDFTTGWNIKRISYAASFGVDEWEFTKDQTQSCAELLSRFDAVTTREDKGVQFCKEHFNVIAQQVLDPTMLLDVTDYISLFQQKNMPKNSGNLMCYILDESEDRRILISAIARRYALTPFAANVPTDDVSLPLSRRIQLPVEQFLRAFYDAEFVVTDSFHACVFSILFNKPFFVYGNAQRGLSRFTSLLHLFGLEDRLILTSKDMTEEVCTRPIDWNRVNATLASLRILSNNVLLQL